MKILGIDPALTITGYGAVGWKQNQLYLLEAGIISTSPKDTVPERLNKIFRAVVKLIRDTKPDVIVLEKIFSHYRHPTTSYILGQARGVICLAAEKENILLAEYAATRIKKAIVGKGLASKSQVQRMVMQMLGLKALPDYTDISDALALAIAHVFISRSRI